VELSGPGQVVAMQLHVYERVAHVLASFSRSVPPGPAPDHPSARFSRLRNVGMTTSWAHAHLADLRARPMHGHEPWSCSGPILQPAREPRCTGTPSLCA